MSISVKNALRLEKVNLKLKQQNNIKDVFIGFAILIASLFMGVDILFFRYANYFQRDTIPIIYEIIIGIAMLLSIIYLLLRYKYFPRFKSHILSETLTASFVGIFILWLLVFFLFLVIFDRNKIDPFISSVINSPPPYFYINFVMLVILTPVLEEILMRGYFFELLKKKWNIKYALLITVIFSMITHYKYGLGVFVIAIYNIVFILLYIGGGLIASIIGHVFLNYFINYFIHA